MLAAYRSLPQRLLPFEWPPRLRAYLHHLQPFQLHGIHRARAGHLGRTRREHTGRRQRHHPSSEEASQGNSGAASRPDQNRRASITSGISHRGRGYDSPLPHPVIAPGAGSCMPPTRRANHRPRGPSPRLGHRSWPYSEEFRSHLSGAEAHKGAVIGTIITNQKVGAPFWQRTFSLQSDGGKDHYCKKLHASAILEDCARTASACAYIGMQPYLIRMEHCQQHRAGVAALTTFAQVARVFIQTISDEDIRRQMIEAGRHLRSRHSDANCAFTFGDASQALEGTLFRPVCHV